MDVNEQILSLLKEIKFNQEKQLEIMERHEKEKSYVSMNHYNPVEAKLSKIIEIISK